VIHKPGADQEHIGPRHGEEAEKADKIHFAVPQPQSAPVAGAGAG
jgi:hypothetical protein